MRDLLVITPTRGRPASASRLLDAVVRTTTAVTDLFFGVDNDDGAYEGDWPTFRRSDGSYGIRLLRGPRATCGEWTNRIAAEFGHEYRAVASLGDDHLPVTPGWDAALLAAIDEMGGTGIAYGDDGLQGQFLPTAPVISSDIVAALGWVFYPPVVHVFADNVWLDLGREAGCLRYVPEVRVEHLHYTAGLSPHDQTYADRDPFWAQDEAAYQAWRRDGMDADAEKIRTLRRSLIVEDAWRVDG
jgi:hypothetical protein